MPQDRMRQGNHIIDRGAETTIDQGAGATGQHQCLTGAWSGTPGEMFGDIRQIAFFRSTSAHQAQDGIDHFLANRQAPDQALCSQQFFAGHDGGRRYFAGTGSNDQHLALGSEAGIVDIDLQQKAIKLRFRQRIGTFLLQWILGGEDMEGTWQGIGLSGNRDLMFLHGLQQGRLRAGTCPVDFIGHQQLAKDRTMNEAEAAAPSLGFFQHFRAGDICRHQIWGALDAIGIQTQHTTERVDQLGLGKARNADQQHMPAGQNCRQGLLDRRFLTKDDCSQGRADIGQPGGELLDIAGEIGWIAGRVQWHGGGNLGWIAGGTRRYAARHCMIRSLWRRKLLIKEGKPLSGEMSNADFSELPLCGDLDMRIARDGTWYYRGSPINRIPLVKLFSTVLRREDDGDYWLVTPAERGRVIVDDAPFTAVEVTATGSGRDQVLRFRTNLDEEITADAAHPIRLGYGTDRLEPAPYIRVRPALLPLTPVPQGLDALILRGVYYHLVEMGDINIRDGREAFGVWSCGVFFPLGEIEVGAI